MTRVLGRYVFREIAIPFLLGTFVLCFVALMPQVVQLADKVLAFGVSLYGVGLLILYLMPPVLLFVIPAAYLLGVLVAFGRLSTDSEMIAMRAGGVSLWQLLPAVLTLGIFASLATGAMSSYGDPWGRSSIRSFLFELGQSKAAGAVTERTFVDDFFGMVIYADSVDPERSQMHGVFISIDADGQMLKKNFSGGGPNDTDQAVVVQAREASILANAEQRSIVLRLQDGTMDHVSPDLEAPMSRMMFKRMDVNILPETTLKTPGRDPYEMYPLDLYGYLLTRGDAATGRDWLAFHKKFAYPFAALLMGIVGMALGISDPRHGKARGYFYGLVAMLLYYLLVRVGDATGERGVMPPIVAAWLPNLVFLVAGIWLLTARAKEKQTFVERLIARVL